MKLNKKVKSIFRILILLIIAVLLALCVYFGYNKFLKNKFKKILEKNDCTNYELTEIANGEETKVYVRDKTLLSEKGDIKTWVSEFDSKRVVFDVGRKTAILDENDETLEVNSLNYSYIKEFFENRNQSFKYLGKENEHYKLQFTESGSKKITIIYLNIETNIVDKMVQNAGNFEFVTEYKVEKNAVSKEEIAYPNLEGYRAGDSSNSNPSTDGSENE